MRTFGDQEFGTGQFGDTTVSNPLNLHVKAGSKTTTALTLEWTAQTGVYGYRLFKNGVPASLSWDGAKTSWRVSYMPGDTFQVLPFGAKPAATVSV